MAKLSINNVYNTSSYFNNITIKTDSIIDSFANKSIKLILITDLGYSSIKETFAAM